jgi:hypothetical protein
MTNIVTGFPMVNAGSLYINGLGIAPGTTTLKVALSSGAARDSTNQDDIVLAADVSINFGVNGANGLDTGSIAASTFYYVYVIASSLSANPETNVQVQVSPIGGTSINGTILTQTTIATPTYSVSNNLQPAGLVSLSATAPTLPIGYDMFRRVGAVLTGGGSTVLPFWQENNGNGTNRKMWYDAPISVLTATASATFVAQSLAVAVPVVALGGTNTGVQLQADLDPAAAADFVEIRPTGSAAAAGNVKMSGDVMSVHHFDQLQCIAAVATGAASIDWMTDAASTVALAVSAYVDKL